MMVGMSCSHWPCVSLPQAPTYTPTLSLPLRAWKFRPVHVHNSSEGRLAT